MSIKEQIDQDLKAAMLAGEKDKVTTLRGVKGAILNVEVAEGKREAGLTDMEITKILQKESKKRQESIELYEKGGNSERADAERKEKAIIDAYLPKQLDESEVSALIDQALKEAGESPVMGQIIGFVKEKSGGAADGAMIAKLVKERLQ